MVARVRARGRPRARRALVAGPGARVSPATADAYLEAFHRERPLGLRALLHRLVAAVATLGTGGALGLEGPSIYLGATLGSVAQRRFRRLLGATDPNLLLVAGAAAGIAAIFKAPATGAIFAIEVPYQDDLARRTLLPALVGAASGYVALAALNGTTPLFPISGSPPITFADLAGAAALGIASAAGARVFAWLLRHAKRVAESAHPVARVIGAGGLFVPLVVAGALVGRAFAGAFGRLDDSLFLVLGIAAFLGAGYRVPLAAIMFVAESTGRPGFVVPALIAAVVAELLMGNASVTAYQQAPSARPRPAITDDP